MNIFIWDHSARQVFMTCKRKYFFMRPLTRDSKEDDSALIRGNGIHHGITTWYSRKDAVAAVTATRERMHERAKRDVSDLHALTDMTMLAYTKEYPEEPFEVLAIEVPLAWEFTSDLYYIGEVDALIKQGGVLLVKETKTTTMMPSMLERRYLMDDQTMGYIWLARQNGIPVKGVLVDVVRVPNGTNVKYPAFYRSTFFPSDALIEEWCQDMMYDAEALRFQNTRNVAATPLCIPRFFTKDTRACFDWNKECGFLPVCLHPDTQEEVLSLYPHRGGEREEGILRAALEMRPQLKSLA